MKALKSVKKSTSGDDKSLRKIIDTLKRVVKITNKNAEKRKLTEIEQEIRSICITALVEVQFDCDVDIM